jgi:hypothetical protein
LFSVSRRVVEHVPLRAIVRAAPLNSLPQAYGNQRGMTKPNRCSSAPSRSSTRTSHVEIFSIVRRNNSGLIRAAADGRATTTANQGKALQQAIDSDQLSLRE